MPSHEPVPEMLSPGALPWIRNYVDGEFVSPDPNRSFDAIDPATGRAFALVHEADRALVDRAVHAARRALDNGWADAPIRERVALLRRVADGIERRFEEFVHAEISDTGKPVSQARGLDVTRAVLNFRTFADIAATTGEDAYLTELNGGRRALNYTIRKPLGVVAVIVPWNLPLLLLTWKVAPALACGNAVVVKPSEETPGTATLLAEVMAEAGAPGGVYNVVHGRGGASAGQYLTEHPRIDGVTFTGSSATGAEVMRTVAPRVRPVSFELGGKNAAIVFDDVDLDETLDGLSRSVFTNTGQVCLCTERIYVHRDVFDDIAEGLVRRAQSLRLSDPWLPTTTTGPLISEEHRRKVFDYLTLAQEAGAEVITGGGLPDMGSLSGGWWVEPTLWTGLTNEDRVVREEVFGPVAALIPFSTTDEAVALANDTEYGLAASIWTNDLRRGHDVAQRMRTGVSWVNTWFSRELRAPFGGVGLSGIGREGGEHSMHFYSQPTNVCVQL